MIRKITYPSACVKKIKKSGLESVCSLKEYTQMIICVHLLIHENLMAFYKDEMKEYNLYNKEHYPFIHDIKSLSFLTECKDLVDSRTCGIFFLNEEAVCMHRNS